MKKIFFFVAISFPLWGQGGLDGAASCAAAKTKAFSKARLQSIVEYSGDTKIDVTYYKLNLNISVSPQYLKAESTISLKSNVANLNNFYLDLKNTLTTDSVLLSGVPPNNKKLTFKHQNDQIQVNLDKNYNIGDAITLKIYYQGKPFSTSGLAGSSSFGFTNHGTGSNQFPIISTLSEPFGTSDWFPSKNTPADKVDSSDVWITAPSQYVSVSNGKLVKMVDNQGVTKTYQWKNSYPIAQYLISIALTNYTQYNNYFKYSAVDSMIITHFIYPENFTTKVKIQLDQTPVILDLLSKKFGLYPFIKEKYGHAQFGFDGGMEHQTCSSMVSFDGGLVAHEMCHQWFGDKITCKNWENIWLNEGFATYGEAIYAEFLGGKTGYFNFITARMPNAKKSVGSIFVQNPTDENEIFDGNRSYYKGAMVLYMLRGIVGDDKFFKIMQTYTASKFAYSVATTEDFQAIAEQVSGVKLDYFFKQWIYGENYPKYTYNWAKIKDGTGFKFAIAINQKTNSNPTYFSMPIDLIIGSASKDTVVTIFNNQSSQNFIIKLKNEPTSLTFDAENKILKDANLDNSIKVSTEDGTAIITANEEINENNSWKISPNPAENEALFEVNLLKDSQINLELINLSGKILRNLINEKLPIGKFQKSFLVNDLQGGKYFLRLNNSGIFSVKSLIIR